MKKELIVVNALTITKQRKNLLKDISFSVNAGEIVSIIGPNGAGKSTLLKAIIGYFPLKKDQIRIHTKKIGYVPQKLEFDSGIPISAVEFMQVFNKCSIKMAQKWLKEVGGINIANRQVKSLSGGEIQKLLIANAMVGKPELLLLDEATAGIDLATEHGFYELIEKLNKTYGITIVMVSHDIHTVFSKSSKVICLNTHMCCHGSPEKVSKDEGFKSIFCDHLSPYKHKHHHTHQ
jgi:zinc transport system ATP-binding protein